MKTYNKRIIIVLLSLIFIISTLSISLFSVFAYDKNSSIEDDKKELQQLKDKYNKVVANKNNAESIIDDLSDNLSDVEYKHAKAEIKIAYLNNQIDTLVSLIEAYNPIIVSVENNIVKLQKEYEMYLDYYSQIVKYAYMEKDISPFEILFEAESISEFLTRLDFVSDILNYSTSVIDSINKTQLRMEESKAEYENAVSQLSKFKETQIELINEQTELLESLEELKGSITIDKDYYDTLINDSNKEAQKLAEEIKKLQQAIKDKQEYINTGWARPLPKHCITVSSPWGERTVFGQYSFHKGIDFPCSVGTNVYAVDKGTVIKATYTYAYGWHIVVDHGGGVSTMYAHGDRLLFSVGDTVKKGEVIMKSGESGRVTGPHLHFAVLVDGEYINPETKGYLDTSSFTDRYR